MNHRRRRVKMQLPDDWARLMRYLAGLEPGSHIISLEIADETGRRPAWRHLSSRRPASTPETEERTKPRQ